MGRRGPVTATVPGPPVVNGDSVSVTIHVTGAGRQKDTDFPLHKKGDSRYLARLTGVSRTGVAAGC
jgi:hypothetical protein